MHKIIHLGKTYQGMPEISKHLCTGCAFHNNRIDDDEVCIVETAKDTQPQLRCGRDSIIYIDATDDPDREYILVKTRVKLGIIE